MEIFYYIMSLMLSVLALIASIFVQHKVVIDDELTMFGMKEIIICLVVSIILMVVGLITDNRNEN